MAHLIAMRPAVPLSVPCGAAGNRLATVHSPTTPVMTPPCASGKTVTEALPTPAAVRKAQQEIAEFRNYQQLRRERVDVSEPEDGVRGQSLLERAQALRCCHLNGRFEDYWEALRAA